MDPNILHITPIWLPITQTWLYNLISNSQEHIPNISIGCEKTDNLNHFPINNLYSLENQNSLSRKIDLKLRNIGIRRHLNYYIKTGRKLKINLIHSHFGNVGWKNIDISKKLKAKHVVTFYGRDVNHLPLKKPKWVYRYHELFEKADIFLCEGPYMANSLIKLGCPSEKVLIQRIGINLNKLPYTPRLIDINKPIKILIAASFKEKKGIPFALNAIGIANKYYNVELTIIGDAPDSDNEKQIILKAIQKNNLSDKTKLLGYLSHESMIKESYNHHLFLQPSITASDGDTEGGAPVSIIEMIATGMPVVSTYHCDIPDIIPTEFHHLLAPEKDSEGLFNCIKYLLENNSDIEHITKSSRLYIEKRHNITSQVLRLKKIYNDLCK